MSSNLFSADKIEPVTLSEGHISRDDFEEVLLMATKAGASDILFRAGSEVRARVNGQIQKISVTKVPFDQLRNWIAQKFKTESFFTSLMAGNPKSTAYDIHEKIRDGELVKRKHHRYRVQLTSVTGNQGGDCLRATFRPISDRPPKLAQLSLPADLEEALLTTHNKGIILISGETGSGKSTLLASVLDQKSRNENIHISTIEDPIEYNLSYVNDETETLLCQTQNELHVQSFPDAIKGLMRDNPDVIMVGELRDNSTISLAAEAARTGHLVFSTLHVSNVAATIDRLSVPFSENSRLAIASSFIDSIRTLVNQQLLPRLCPHCSVPEKDVYPNILASVQDRDHFAPRKPVGCEECHGTGFSSRTPIIEYLTLSEPMRNELMLELLEHGVSGVTSTLHKMVEKQGRSRFVSAAEAFARGEICQKDYLGLFLEQGLSGGVPDGQ